MFYTQIPLRHIHRLGGGCPSENVNVKVRRRSKNKIFQNSNVIIYLHIITMFVFRKVTVDVYECKTILYYVLYAICINTKWPTHGKYICIYIYIYCYSFSESFFTKVLNKNMFCTHTP